MAPTTRSSNSFRKRQPASAMRGKKADISTSRNSATKQPRAPKSPMKRSFAAGQTNSRSKDSGNSAAPAEPRRSFQNLTGFSPTVKGNPIYAKDGTYIGRFSSHSPDKPVFRPGTARTPTPTSGTPLKTTYVRAPYSSGSATPLTSIFAPITGSSHCASLPSASREASVPFGLTQDTPNARSATPRQAQQAAPTKAAATRRQSTHRGNPTIDTNSHVSGILYAIYREVHDVQTFLGSEAYHPAFDSIIEALGSALEAIYDADQEVIAAGLDH